MPSHIHFDISLAITECRRLSDCFENDIRPRKHRYVAACGLRDLGTPCASRPSAANLDIPCGHPLHD